MTKGCTLYNTVTVREICNYITSGGTPSSTVENYYVPAQIPWLKTKEVNYSRIYETENYISRDGLEHSSAKLIPENSVIVAMYGQGDTAGRVAINKIPLTTNQACCNLVIDAKKADYNYIYYALSGMYEKLVSLKNGGAQPNLNAKIIGNIRIELPDTTVQRRIADILSAYDDLIENNRKQIKLLEEAAQRLYKEWFVDLRFPGWETTEVVDGVPVGWKTSSINELGHFVRGKTITKSDVNEGDVPVVAGEIEPAYYHNVSNTEMPVITISGSGANAGFTRIYFQKIWASDCSYVDSTGSRYIYFVYCFLKNSSDAIKKLQKGSAQPHVYAKDINALTVTIPNMKMLRSFEEHVRPCFNAIANCNKIIMSATEARDRLLPKLMSGELEV